MRVRLPDGTVVNNVPDGTSKEEFTLKAIENGYLDPSYGEGISRPQNPTPEGDIFSSVRNFASNLMPTQQNVPLQPQGKPQAPEGKSWTQRFNEEIQKITPVDSAGDYWSKTFEGFSGDRLAAGMASSINEAGLGLSQAAREQLGPDLQRNLDRQLAAGSITPEQWENETYRLQSKLSEAETDIGEAQKVGQFIADEEAAQMPEGMDILQRAVRSGTSSVALNTPATALSIMNKNPFAMTYYGGNAAAGAYADAKREGADDATATTRAAIAGTSEILTEVIPGKLLGKIFKNPDTKDIAGYLVGEQVGEATNFLVNTASDVKLGTGVGAVWDDLTDEQKERYLVDNLKDTAAATLFASTVQGGIPASIGSAVKKGQERQLESAVDQALAVPEKTTVTEEVLESLSPEQGQKGTIGPLGQSAREEAQPIQQAPNIRFSKKPDEEDSPASFFRKVAENEGSFKTPRSDKTELADIAQETGINIKAQEVIGGGRGGADVIRLSRTVKDDMGDYDKDALDLHYNGDDDSNNQPYVRIYPGSGYEGSALYQMAFNWAHNNDKTIVPDPAGITKINRLRRNEAMISSALKFNTTEHLEPHRDQFVGLLSPEDFARLEDETPGFTGSIKVPEDISNKLERIKNNMWKTEKGITNKQEKDKVFNENLNHLINASTQLVQRRVPQFEEVSYNEDGQITYQDKPIGNLSDFLVEQGIAEQASVSGVGDATLRRGALSKQFMQSNRLERDAEDGAVRDQATRPVSKKPTVAKRRASRRSLAADTEGIFYKKSEERSTKKVSHSAVIREIEKSPDLAKNVRVVRKASALPRSLYNEVKKQKFRVPGVFYNGKAYVITENLKSVEEGVISAIHEGVGHKGIRGVLGKESDSIFEKVYNSKNKEMVKLRQRIEKTYPDADSLEVGEEMIAHYAEMSKKPTTIDWALSKIKSLIRKVFNISMSPKDLNILLQKSRDYLAEQKPTNIVEAIKDSRFSLKPKDKGEVSVDKPVKSDKSSALQAFGRRYLTKTGLLSDQYFEKKIESDSLKNADEIDLEFMVAKLERAVKDTYKKRYASLSEAEKKAMSDYLGGDTNAKIKIGVKPVLNAMRGYLDKQSDRIMQMSIDNMDFYLESLNQTKQAEQRVLVEEAVKTGNVSEELDAYLEKEALLYNKIKQNKGKYVNRSYQAFDDPDWSKKVRKDTRVIKDAEALIRRDLKGQGVTDDNLESRVKGEINKILFNAEKGGDFFSFLTALKPGMKDVSILKRKKEVPPQIRALLGEITDPRLNFVRSGSKMSGLVANHHFLKNMREIALEEGLLTKEPVDDKYVQITASNPETMSPLTGLYTTEDMATAISDVIDKEQVSDFIRTVRAANGLVKYGKTVLSPTTQARNFISAYFFTIMNGHFNPLKTGKAFGAIRGRLKKSEDWQSYLNTLAKMGVIHDNPRADELKDALSDVIEMSERPDSKFNPKLWAQWATDLYQASDDFWKIVGFENEVADQVRLKGLSREEAEKIAAKRIRDGYPTYSLVPKGIKNIRRWYLIGTFVSFPWEVMRTTKNQLGFIAEDVKDAKKFAKDGEAKKSAGSVAMAAKRSAGVVVAASLARVVAEYTKDLLGLDDEDEEAIRELAAPWQRNSDFLFMDYNDTGDISFIDLSQLDPYTYLKKPVTALATGNKKPEEKLVDSLQEILEPFLGVDIAAGTIINAYSNKNDFGGEIYENADDPKTKAYKVFQYLRKNLQPSVVNNFERLYKSNAPAINEIATEYPWLEWMATSKYSRSGREYTNRDEIKALFGIRATDLGVADAMVYKGYDFQDEYSGSTSNVSRALGGRDTITLSKIEDTVKKAVADRKRAFKKMSEYVGLAKKLGLSETDVFNVLSSSGISKANAKALSVGRYVPWKPDKGYLGRQQKRYMALAKNPEERKKISTDFNWRRAHIIKIAREAQK